MPFSGVLVNGKRFDFSSLEIALFGKFPMTSVQEISWTQSLEPGTERGTSAVKLGRTRGEYEATGSITLSKADAFEMKAQLVGLGLGGYMEAEFLLTITYFEIGSIPIVDTLRGCRVTNEENGHSSGGDNLQTTFELDIMQVEENGISAVAPLGGGGVGGLLGQ